MSKKPLKFKVIDKSPHKSYRHLWDVFVIREDGTLYVTDVNNLEKVVDNRFSVEIDND